jgi:site-specific recombinase XerD
MDLRILTAEFLASKAAGGRSPATIYNYQWNLESFLTWCNQEGFTGNDLVGPVGAETIEEHMLYMANCDYRPHTISQRYRALRALYRWVERRHGRMEAGNPFDMLTEPTTPDLLPKAATYAQLQVLLHSIKPSKYGVSWTAQRDRLILKLFFFTGIRVSEMASLRIEDVDLERRRLRVQRHKTKSIDLVPFSRSLHAELTAWLSGQRPAAPHGGLWPASTGDRHIAPEPLTDGGIKQMCRYRCEAAGLPVLMPHSLRHGCAVYIIEKQGDISLVKRILGHKDIRTSQIYLRFDTDQVTGLYDRIFE